jgi:aldehyde dehydrogenase (NAD+)
VVFACVEQARNFETVGEVATIANSTEYGLITHIRTNDIKKAYWVASKARAEQVFVNNHGAGGGIEMPLGGYGKSCSKAMRRVWRPLKSTLSRRTSW